MKRLSINKKISLAYNYTKLKFPHIHLWSLERYKLLTIRIPDTTTKKYLIEPLFDTTQKEFEKFVLKHFNFYKRCLSNTPDEAIKHVFPRIPSYEEIQLFLEIAGN